MAKMSSTQAAVSRSGAADVGSNRVGRLDWHDWRTVDRAILLGKKRNLLAVNINGMHFVLRKGAQHLLQEPKGKKATSARTKCPSTKPASAPAAEVPRPPNSNKRRSAQRRELYILAQGWSRSQKATTQPRPTEPVPERPAPVETDVRMGDAPAETAAKEHRGQKRATVEPMGPAPKSWAAAATKQPPQPQQQQQKRPAVETTVRPATVVAKQPVAAAKQPQQQQQQSHAAETAAKSVAAAAKAATTRAPAAASPGQKLRWTDHGLLRPDGTVDTVDWKCRGCGQPEITGSGKGGVVLLGCTCRAPIWHKSGRLL